MKQGKVKETNRRILKYTKIQNNMEYWNITFSLPHIGKLGKQYVKFFYNVHKIVRNHPFVWPKPQKYSRKTRNKLGYLRKFIIDSHTI